MKAILSTAAGRQEADWPRPQPGPHDLLVQVEALAVNPIDAKQRATIGPGDAPRILGWDFAGTVTACGKLTHRFQPGDRVIGAGDSLAQGCQAEWVRIEEPLVGRWPPGLEASQAAALPLTGLTAWEALFERLGLDADGGHAGRSLLILGGAGGVGSIAIQLARRAGLTVIASASRPESVAWVRRMGAHHVVNHRQPLGPQLQALGHASVNHILNAADTDGHWNAMADAIAPQGSIVALVSNRGPLDLNLLKARSVAFHWEFMFTRPLCRTADRGRQGEILEQLAALLASGALQSTVSRVLSPISVAQLERAETDLTAGSAIGKTVLTGWGPG